jgi:hybrid cluster-associated redox disulfide protein
LFHVKEGREIPAKLACVGVTDENMNGSGASAIHQDMIVQRVLDLWPRTVHVFVDRRMACVGCSMAAFETIEEVARNYDQDPDVLLLALRECAVPGDKAEDEGPKGGRTRPGRGP